ncbi:MAG: hypothetical protein P2A85_09120 [Microcoleus anatoxicus]|uniref:hypothetical protein n=1 Tax=Microcoleus anatoxicus TaxID=2705319 RepID=UPI00367257CB
MEDNIDRIQAKISLQPVIEQLNNHGERLDNHGEQLTELAQEVQLLSESIVDHNALLQYQATLNKLLIGILERQSFVSIEEQNGLAQLNKSLNILVEAYPYLFDVEVF